ncbi:MAG TPA: SDR family oxidoreductase [Casimicrobiaceae bacterium]|jgi:NAD(P)-dependent dehydrogenase (short-subunit alcohol dehydrogenase family)|nr:SDR family oxidoreductase [Casimicrobiaceae bacterium]
MARELEGRVILVTGGARGLGAAICGELADAGATLLVADRSERAHETAQAARAQGVAADALIGDIGDEAQVRRFIAHARDAHGGLDAVINNAGIDVTTDIESLEVEQWDAVLRTNLRAPFLIAKLALPLLRERKGDIVNVASTAAKRAWPNAAAYHASKWGLLGLTYALHAELRPLGVRVTAVVAGGMRTPFLLDRFPDLDPSKLQDPRNVARAVRFALTQPRESVIAEIAVLPVQETSWP